MRKLLIILVLGLLFTQVNAQLQVPAVASSIQVGGGLGPEKITNGGFADATSWSASAGVTISSGVCSFDGTSYQSLTQTDANMVTSLSINTDYTIAFDMSNSTGGGITVSIRDGSSGVTYVVSNTYPDGSYSIDFTTPADIGVGGVRFRVGSSSGTGDMDNVSVKERL